MSERNLCNGGEVVLEKSSRMISITSKIGDIFWRRRYGGGG